AEEGCDQGLYLIWLIEPREMAGIVNDLRFALRHHSGHLRRERGWTEGVLVSPNHQRRHSELRKLRPQSIGDRRLTMLRNPILQHRQPALCGTWYFGTCGAAIQISFGKSLGMGDQHPLKTLVGRG